MSQSRTDEFIGKDPGIVRSKKDEWRVYTERQEKRRVRREERKRGEKKSVVHTREAAGMASTRTISSWTCCVASGRGKIDI